MKNSCKSVALKGFARIAALRRTALSIGVLLALGVSTAALLKAQAAAPAPATDPNGDPIILNTSLKLTPVPGPTDAQLAVYISD